MDGMSIVPSAPSVLSLASVITPVGVGAVHSFAPRSGDISVLLVLTAPAALSGRTVFGGGGAGIGGVMEGDGQLGILGGRGWKELRSHSKMPRSGSFQRWSWW